jgi:ribosome-associated heat shock protein Hsp15
MPSSDPIRIDKWLWAARLVKTRALAVEAVNGGRVHVNGQRVKPSKDVGPGDELEISVGPVRRTVIVRGTAPRRTSAKLAQELYEETPESIELRERHEAQARLTRPPVPVSGPRPTKRDRRRMEQTPGVRRGRR